jgi:hypothetical protein
MRFALLALSLALACPAALAHDDDDGDGRNINRVNRGITAEAGRSYGDLETVNGGITVEAGVSADTVETVNGGITVGDHARLGSLETVNGGIHASRDVQVARGAETVNGGIRFEFGSSVGGDITTVNGGITVKQTRVRGRIETVGGDITVGNGSVVDGGILVQKPQGISWGRHRTPRIIIGPNAVVNGTLRFEREVELFVHPSAKIGAVSGATVQRYTDKLPARRDD